MSYDPENDGIGVREMTYMSIAEYRDYVTGGGGMFLDHNRLLRDAITGRPLASSAEQADVLIQYLQRLRSSM